MKFLPDVSYLSNLFKRKSGMLQTSTDSGLVIPPNTTVITIDEPDSPITLQLLAEQQHHQRSQQLNPRAPLWQRILKATKNNVLQKNQQSKKVKNPRISPRLQPTTATATTCNVSIRFTKDSTSKIEKAVPHQFQIHHINNKLDHKDGDLLNYPSEKLAIPITTTKDHTIITIEPSLEAGPSSAEASGSDSNNGNVFALNSNLASPTMSDTKKENIKVNGLYSSNVWAPKNVKSEEGWRVTLKKQFQKYQYKKQKSRQQQYQQQLPAYGVNGMLCYGSRMKNEALAYNGNGTQFYPVPPTLYPQPPPLAPPHLNQFNQPIPQDPCVQYAPQPMHHPFMLQTAQHHFHPPGLGPYTHAQQFYTASIAHLHVQQSIQPSIIPSCRITPIYDTIPQPVQPHAPQPVSTLAQDLSFEQGREQINQNLRDILHFADQCNAREQERELNHLLRSAKTINPVTTNSQQSNHQVDIELGQQFSDDEEEEDNDDDDEIEDKKGKRTAIRVPFRKPRQILAVNAAYVPSDNPGARSPSGFHKLIDIFQQERTLFMQDLNYYRCTVKKGLPWWDYYRLAIIGDGLCGKVYSAVRLKQADKVHGPKICAIKTLQLVYDDRQNNKKIFESESLLREIYIMTQMRHRNLMRLDEVFVDKNTVYMVMPMMRCSLVNVINSRSEASLAEGYAVYASLEVNSSIFFFFFFFW
jgi:hypothetical protein